MWDGGRRRYSAAGCAVAKQPSTLALVVACVQVDGLGIGSVESLFTDFGYKRRDAFAFPAKKLRVGGYGYKRVGGRVASDAFAFSTVEAAGAWVWAGVGGLTYPW